MWKIDVENKDFENKNVLIKFETQNSKLITIDALGTLPKENPSDYHELSIKNRVVWVKKNDIAGKLSNNQLQQLNLKDAYLSAEDCNGNINPQNIAYLINVAKKKLNDLKNESNNSLEAKRIEHAASILNILEKMEFGPDITNWDREKIINYRRCCSELEPVLENIEYLKNAKETTENEEINIITSELITYGDCEAILEMIENNTRACTTMTEETKKNIEKLKNAIVKIKEKFETSNAYSMSFDKTKEELRKNEILLLCEILLTKIAVHKEVNKLKIQINELIEYVISMDFDYEDAINELNDIINEANVELYK